MDKKNIKKYLGGINEIELRNMFNDYKNIQNLKVPGFNYKTIKKVPKNILINKLIEYTNDYDSLYIHMQKYYSKIFDYSEYENTPFEEKVLNKTNLIPLLTYYLLNGDQDIKDKIEKFIEYEKFDKLLNENSEIDNANIEEANVINVKKENDKKSNKEIDMIIQSLNEINADLKDKNSKLSKEIVENKAVIKDLNRQKKDYKIEIEKLNKAIEKLNLQYELEQDKTMKLNNLLKEKEQELNAIILKNKKSEMERHKVGVLQDEELNEDRGIVYIVSNNHAGELIKRFDKFEYIYILERSVSESVRRKLIKKEKETNRRVLYFVNEDKVIEEIIGREIV